MFDIVKVNDKTYYLKNPSIIGIYTPDGKNAYAIDTSGSDTSAKKLLEALDTLGLTLKAIINTHSHADHIGGNAYCQQQTRCKIYAPGLEYFLTNNPTFEPVYLFGGKPPKKLLHKLFAAKASIAEPVTPDVLPEGLEMIPLPGHSFDETAYRTAEGVVFLGDALISEQTLNKYGITFNYDIAAEFETLDKLKTLEGTLFVPCHAEPTDDLSGLIEINRNGLKKVVNTILNIIKTPKTFDEVLSDAFNVFTIEINDAQFALLGFTVRSYLVYLENEELAKHYFRDNKMYWEAI